MDDVIPATRRMTYAELGQARGISAKSAERLAQRRRWPRQIGNDGMARVLVPFGEDHVTPRRQGRMVGPDIAGRRGPDIGGVVRDAIRETVETLVNPLREQLEAERARADRAEKRADEERARADQERDRADRERDRASQAEKLITELRAPPPAAEPPRTGWNRFLAWWKEH